MIPYTREAIAQLRIAANKSTPYAAVVAQFGCSLFEACFRIQREACEAAGRHIPMIVENVRGAQKWVGRARWNHGSFYLWGDVPALMPTRFGIRPKFIMDDIKNGQRREIDGIYVDGIKCGGDWFGPGIKSEMRKHSSKSPARKMASAMIAKIPLPLGRHIARTFAPTPPHTPIVTHPRPADDSHISRQCESSTPYTPSTGTSS